MRRAMRPEPPVNPVQWGYRVFYRPGQVNHCPGCGRSHWLVGRVSAQCAFCGTALALALASPWSPGEPLALTA